jgi:uncharacterized protein (UPF0333 family)
VDSKKLAFPLMLLVAVLFAIIAVGLYLMGKKEKDADQPEQFANTVLNKNKKVFERLADM